MKAKKLIVVPLLAILLVSTFACGGTNETVVAVDSDGDGWTDVQEQNAGTDPYSVDTDGDGYWDMQDPNPLDSNIPPGEPTPLSSPTPTRTPKNYDDAAFTSWAIETMDVLSVDAEMLTYAFEVADLGLISMWADVRWLDADNALDEIGRYDVSGELLPFKIEFTLYLQDAKEASHYTQRWVETGANSDLNMINYYQDSAIMHIEQAADLLP